MLTTECTDYTAAQEAKIAELTAEVEKLRVAITHAFNDGFMYSIERDADNNDGE